MLEPSFLAKIGATAVAVGLASGAGMGAFGGWTDTDNAAMAVQFGNVEVSLPINTLTTAFGTTAAPLAPGDSGVRYITLSNSGANGVALSTTMWASIGSITDAVGTAATAADIAADLRVTIDSCSVAWNQTLNTCGGTTTSVLAASYLTVLDTSGEAQTMTSSLASGSTLALRFTLTVDALASITSATDGAAVTITWTFNSSPRAAVTTA